MCSVKYINMALSLPYTKLYTFCLIFKAKLFQYHLINITKHLRDRSDKYLMAFIFEEIQNTSVDIFSY